ncbi:hypothetical protein PA0774 [Candidatus Phytoplasma australiense]|uniref:Uncharacterized protein n=1 Tax=Phytoplasma australiense TaxID=59748 RepID=B1VAY5_PHYAS|nr:hypothetical protein PA0774 [Candidatus Phytoplasma australiense]
MFPKNFNEISILNNNQYRLGYFCYFLYLCLSVSNPFYNIYKLKKSHLNLKKCIKKMTKVFFISKKLLYFKLVFQLIFKILNFSFF